MTYKFYSYDFTAKEISQICTLVQMWMAGHIQAVKRNTLSKQVIRYALNWKLLEERADGKLYFPQYSTFDTVYDLPVEVLWRTVEPMLRIGEQTGYSIVNNARWEALNIYPQNSRHASDRDLQAKEEILFELSGYHYIYFNMAGTTWCIYREQRMAA